MSQDMSPGFRPLRQGGGPRPRPTRPDLQPPNAGPPSRAAAALRDYRGVGWLLTLGLVFALGPLLRTWVDDAAHTLEGEGYVRWRYPAWKAKQAAVKLQMPLVIVRADRESEAYDRFRQRVLAHPCLTEGRASAVWLSEPPPAHGPPELGIYESDGATAITPPLPLDQIDPAALASELREYDAERRE